MSPCITVLTQFIYPGGANRYESIYMYCVDLFPAEPRKFLKRKMYVAILSVFFVLSHAFSCFLPLFFLRLSLRCCFARLLVHFFVPFFFCSLFLSFFFFRSVFFLEISFLLGAVYHVTTTGSLGGQLKCDDESIHPSITANPRARAIPRVGVEATPCIRSTF